MREKRENSLETPGGTLEGKEKIEECAIREALEETGLEVKLIKILDLIRHKDHRGDVLAIIYLAEPLSKVSDPLGDVTEVRWVDRDEIGKMLENGLVDWHDIPSFKWFVSLNKDSS